MKLWGHQSSRYSLDSYFVNRMGIFNKILWRIFAWGEAFKKWILKKQDYYALKKYLSSIRRPWSDGYHVYRDQILRKSISDVELMDVFRKGSSLPEGYAARLDARLVEIPWVLSRLRESELKILDAGSSLNRDFVLGSSQLKGRDKTILTLAPESDCFWRMNVSYVFGDLRTMNFQDESFDAVICVSTIEHVGMDNTMYAETLERAKNGAKTDFLKAIDELKRVLRKEGHLYITFPFGRYEDHGWLQQFDLALAQKLIERFSPSEWYQTIYRHTLNGWCLSHADACKDLSFFDVHKSRYFDSESNEEYPRDYPAAERAVMCLELKKV